ncbi:MAG: YegP family protein [Pyrinomonadaceae bacterium]
MTDHRDILKGQRTKFEEKARGLKCYVKELTETAAKCGTDEALFEEDLTKAKGDLEFYEGQVGHCTEALGDADAHRTFSVYKDAGGEWRWRLVAGNGRIIAASGEGYQHRQDCLHGIELVKDSKDVKVEDGD